MLTVNRRDFLAWCALAPNVARAAPAANAGLERIVIELEGSPRLARKATLLLPPGAASPSGHARLLVLLHGLGETGNEQLALKAWSDLYGLVTSDARLRAPPVKPLEPKQRWFSRERADELNRELGAAPYAGCVMICPVTPNPHKTRDPAATLDRYADWICDQLLPAVRRRLGVPASAQATAIDGCSLGGYVALEAFLRRPAEFGALGTIQGAFGARAAERYAERIAAACGAHGARRVHVQSSTEDPYLPGARALARSLAERGVAHTLSVAPGPHNQPWLREIGTLEKLLWYDRNLGARR